MRQDRSPRPESTDKAADHAATTRPVDPGEMERFKELARRFVNVPRDELRRKQEQRDVADAEHHARREGRAR
jgi:hypothetical protein